MARYWADKSMTGRKGKPGITTVIAEVWDRVDLRSAYPFYTRRRFLNLNGESYE